MVRKISSLRLFIGLSILVYTVLGSVIILAQGNIGNWETLNTSGSASPRHESGMVEAGGLLYLIGGRGTRDTDIYNPIANSWSDAAQPPVEIHHIQPVELDGLIYVVAALSGQCCDSEFGLSHVYIYDPLEDEWYQGAEIPANRRRGSVGAVVYNDEIYIVGGLDGGHGSSATSFAYFDKYNPATNQWTVLEDAPRARDHFNAVLVGDEMYLAGGRQTDVGSFFANTLAEVDVYNFTTGQWRTLPSSANIPTERAGTLAAAIGNEVIVVGGETTQSQAHDETEALNTNNDTWRTLDTLNEGRHSGGMVVCNDTLYAVAGSNILGGLGEIGSTERFSFNGATTCPRSPFTVGTLVGNPSPLNFGNVDEDSNSSRTLDINNTNGSQAILITDVDLADADEFGFSLPYSLPVVIAPNSSLSIQVSFAPDNQGTFNDTLTVEHTAGADLTINMLGVAGDGVGAPVIDPIADQTLAEGLSRTININVADDNSVMLGFQVWDDDGIAVLPSDPLYSTIDNGNKTGSITFTPQIGDADDSPYNVTITAIDSQNNLVTETFVLTVEEQQAPTFNAVAPVNLTATSSLVVPISATDVEGDTISLSMIAGQSFASFVDLSNGSGQLTLSPAHGAEGNYSVTIEASDAYGSNTINIPITVTANQQPIFVSIADLTMLANEQETVIANATDPEGQAVSYRLLGVANSLDFITWNGVDTMTIAPSAADVGTYRIIIEASDGILTKWDVFDLIIELAPNDPPVFDPIADINMETGEVETVTVNAVDPEGQPVTYRVIRAANLPSFITWNGVDTFTIAPNTGDVGTYFVAVEASDGVTRRWERFQVTVSAGDTNERPVFDTIGNYWIGIGRTGTLTVNAVDPEGQPVTYRVIRAANLPSFMTWNGVDTFTISPDIGDNGSYRIVVEASDGVTRRWEIFFVRVVNPR